MVCSGIIFFFSSISSLDLGHFFQKWVEKIYFFCPTACHIYGVQWDLFFYFRIISGLGAFFEMSWKILLLLSHCTPYLWCAVGQFFFSSISSVDLGHFSKMSWKILLLLSYCMPYLWSAVGQFFFSSISSLDLGHFSKMSWKILLLLSHCMPYLWSAVDNFFLVPYHLWTWGIFQKWVEKLCFYCPTACHIYGVQWDHIFFSSISSLDLGHFFQKWVEKIYFFCPTACHIYGVQWDLFFLLPHHLGT